MSDIDQTGLRQLAEAFGFPVRDYLREGPKNRRKLFTALNALAGVVGYLIAGTGDDGKIVRAWFDECLDEQISDARALDETSRPATFRL
jgi:hypothetical protein